MNIHKHLPKSVGETRTVAVKIPAELKDRVAEMIKSEGVSWNDLIIACLKAYVEETERMSKRDPKG